MIVARTFAWSHLPKTGGDLTAAALGLFPEAVVYRDPPERKHKPFDCGNPLLEGRVLVLNIRRLPSWLLSFFHYRALYGVEPDRTPIPVEPPELMARSRIPDGLIWQFTDLGRVEIDRWLRMETLTDDLFTLLDDLGEEVSEERRSSVLALGRLNEIEYDKDPRSWFSEKQLDLMYRTNHVWAAIERAVYGDLAL